MSSQAVHGLLQMECDLRNIRRWAGVLHHLGASADDIAPGEIHVIAIALSAIGSRLESDWDAALQDARREQ